MSVWGGRGRKNGIYRNLLESINDTLPRIPLVTVMPRVCRDCRHVRLREWNEMWGDIKCAVLNFFSHADNRRTKSLSATNSWKNPHRSVSLDQNGFNSDFYQKTFQVVWGTKKSFFSLLQTLLFNPIDFGKDSRQGLAAERCGWVLQRPRRFWRLRGFNIGFRMWFSTLLTHLNSNWLLLLLTY